MLTAFPRRRRHLRAMGTLRLPWGAKKSLGGTGSP
eukprot:COSAG01_NODE_4372_length_5087_cov_39.002406_3_plen_34_part_01